MEESHTLRCAAHSHRPHLSFILSIVPCVAVGAERPAVRDRRGGEGTAALPRGTRQTREEAARRGGKRSLTAGSQGTEAGKVIVL